MILSGKAYAKINLSLDIISKMDDGYHYLKTVMQTVGLCDEITAECIKGNFPGVKVVADTGLSYIPSDGRNVACKAAEVFFAHTGISGYNLNIGINKQIPVCAGLGGGSADAACVLRILNEMFGTGLAHEVLEQLGNSVGSDVPFCIGGGTKLCEGRGEILTGLKPVPKCFVVICKPPFNCSTPELFGHVSVKDIRIRPDTGGLIKAIDAGDLRSIARHMYNVFEDVLTNGKSDVDFIKSIMLENRAQGALMTGSGPSVFGLFDSKDNAHSAYEQLCKSYKDCFITETIEGIQQTQ